MLFQMIWNTVPTYREQLPNCLETIPTTLVSRPTI